jgi:cytidylate kinase
MKITLGGVAGTGKGTVGRLLAEHYGYEYISGGDLFRKAAIERGMTMEEFDAWSSENGDTNVDKEVDAVQIQLSKSDKSFVLESRLAWHFVPSSIKVRLDCDLDERIKRIANDTSGNRLAYTQESFETTKAKTLKRFKDHQAKIAELYGIVDMVADEHFDFIVDTTHSSPQEVTAKIIEYINTKQ